MATHRVRPGDTIEGIANDHYGHPSAWTRVLHHNQGRIQDRDRLNPGTILHLPASRKDAPA